jgi:hypothetical protein
LADPFDNDRFQKCLIVSQTNVQNKFDSYATNFTSNFTSDLLMIESIPVSRRKKRDSSLLALYYSWDWTKPYPPLHTAPHVYSRKDFEYYINHRPSDDMKWLEWAFTSYDDVIPEANLIFKMLAFPTDIFSDFYAKSGELERFLNSSNADVLQANLLENRGRKLGLNTHTSRDHRALKVYPEFELAIVGSEVEVSVSAPVGEVVTIGLGLSIDLADGVVITGSGSGCALDILCLEGSISVAVTEALQPPAPFPVSSEIALVYDLNNYIPGEIKVKASLLRQYIGAITYKGKRGATNVQLPIPYMGSNSKVIIGQMANIHDIDGFLSVIQVELVVLTFLVWISQILSRFLLSIIDCET